MKKIKKIFALLIAMVMVLGMSTAVFAAQSEGTTASIQITTDATLEGATANTYNAYKIFDATYDSLTGTNNQAAKDPTYSPDDAAVAYFMKTGNPWISTVQGMTNYFTVKAAADNSGYTVELKEGVADSADTAKAIATALKTALSSLTLTGDYTGIPVTAGGAAVNVQPGYYLIASDTATNLQLITTNVTIVEKNEYVHDEKIAETASVSIGESATYYVKVFIPANVNTTLPVVVHDVLPEQLSFNNDVKVSVSTTDPAADATTDAAKRAAYAALTYSELGDAYTVKTSDMSDTTCTFEISINTTSLKGNYIVFKYSAELLATAASDTGYVNREYTTYSDYKTTPSTPEVKTYDFNIKKVDSQETQLTGAEFELRNAAGTAYEFFAVTGGYKKVDTKDATTVDATKVTKLAAGNINIAGLGAGTYNLVETKAPTGFNQLDAPVIITIADDGTITATYKEETLTNVSDLFTIENQAGSVLPSTGGIGTTIFYIIGAILVIGAGVVLVTRRRMNAN